MSIVTQSWPRMSIIGLAIAFFVLGLIYSWATPPFEASDEYWHFGMLEYIHDYHALPVQDPDFPDTLWKQEGSQPPLFYVISAALITPFDLDRVEDFRVHNPHARVGQPDSFRNKNLVMHDSSERFPGESMLAVYVVRLFGITLGLITVVAVYSITRLVAPNQPYVSVLAAGLLAFNPMFLFISASINNDNLVTALSSLVIFLMLRVYRQGFDLRRSIWLAVLVTFATLAKLSALVLLPVIALVALATARKRNDWRGLVILGGLIVGIWVALAGWWYLRNIQLYDELFGTSMMVSIAGGREDAFTLSTALDEFQGFRWAFWGVFGVFNLVVPYRLFYTLLDVIVFTAGIGLLFRFRSGDRGPLLSLSLIVIIGFIAFLVWTMQTYASQGRLLFPYVGAIMPLMAVGMVNFLRQFAWLRHLGLPAHKIPSWLVIWPIPFLAVTTLVIPFTFIAPSYRVPTPLDDDQLPGEAIPVYARFGNVELVGYEFEDRRYSPGENVPVTLYWKVLARSALDNSLYLTFLSPDGQELGKVDSYPGGGNLRTSTWESERTYADTYHVSLGDNIIGNYQLRLQVGWWYYLTEEQIRPHDALGQPLDSVMLDTGALVSRDIDLDVREFVAVDSVQFGDVIRLRGYAFHSEQNELRLRWESTGSLPEDYIVFAQVLDAENEIVGQGDAPPLLPTRYWLPGEQFLTQHSLHYPEGVHTGYYRIIVGWYHSTDFARLQTNHQDNAYTVLEFTR